MNSSLCNLFWHDQTSTTNDLARRQSFLLEPLENRLLLSVDTVFPFSEALVAAVDVNASSQAGTQSEVGIAVNPTNPLNMVAVANNNVNLTQLAAYFSTDGGITWTASFITSADDGFGAGETRFDPNVAFDSDGNVYVVYSMANAGGANDSRLVVARSTDGGANWTATQVTNDAANTVLHTAMVTTRPDPAGADDVFVTVARVVGGLEEIEAYLSLDAGATFTVVNGQLNDAAQRTFLPWAFADEFGDFHVVWEVDEGADGSDPEGALFHDVLDGTTLVSGADVEISDLQITDFANANSKIPAQPNRGLFSVSTVDIDLSGGPFDGRIYVSYSDRLTPTSNDLDIFVRFSDDNGASWSDPIQVNDDSTLTSQFMPRMSIDQTTGHIYLAWYDARNDTTNNRAVNIYAAVSNDGGATWSPNVRVSQEESDVAIPGNNGNDYTEYMGLSARDGGAYITWTDKRASNFGTNLEDVFVGYVAFAGQDVTVSGDLNGTPTNDNIVLALDASGTFVQVTIGGAVVYTQAKSAVDTLTILGLGGNDTLTVDYTNGDPVPLGGLHFDGGPQAGTPGDRIVLDGTGIQHGLYLPSSITPGAGTLFVDGRVTTFAGLEPVVVSDFFELTLQTPNSNDALTVDSPAAGQNRVSGTSGVVPFEALTFFDVDHFLIDTATNDAPLAGPNDSVTFTADVVATGLQSFAIQLGDGINQVNASAVLTQGIAMFSGSGNDNLLGGGGDDLIDGGGGRDSLVGAGGADTLIGGDEFDIFTWNPGDGNDVIEGGDGDNDVMFFNGSAAAEIFTLTAVGTHLLLLQTGGTVIDAAGVEQVNVVAGAGGDTVAVNDLTGTDVQVININLGIADLATDAVIVRGTAAADDLTATVSSGVMTVDGLDYDVNVSSANPEDHLTVNGNAGNDSISVNVVSPGAETVVYTPTASDGGTFDLDPLNLDLLSSPLIISGAEVLTYDGGGDGDSLTVAGTDGDDTIVHNPGANNQAGSFQVDSLLALNYQNLGSSGSLTADGAGGTDTLVVNGTAVNDDFMILVGGEVDLNTRLVLNTANVENLTLEGLAGDDTFTLVPAISASVYGTINLNGGSQSSPLPGGDRVNLIGTGGADNITISGQVVSLGVVTVNSSGIENITLDALGGDDSITYEGVEGVSEDIKIASSVVAGNGQVSVPDVALINFISVRWIDVESNAPGPTETDTLTFAGTNNADRFEIDLAAAGTSGDPILELFNNGTTLLTLRNYTGFDTLRTLGLAGADTFNVITADIGTGRDLFVDGGLPSGKNKSTDKLAIFYTPPRPHIIHSAETQDPDAGIVDLEYNTARFVVQYDDVEHVPAAKKL
jgi:hypothetical protein